MVHMIEFPRPRSKALTLRRCCISRGVEIELCLPGSGERCEWIFEDVGVVGGVERQTFVCLTTPLCFLGFVFWMHLATT